VITTQLKEGETLLWQGRPAPRCYTFRNWKHALFGMVLFFPTLFWTTLSWQLFRAGESLLLPLVTVPFLLLSFWLAFGHLFKARWEWEQLFYSLSDQRLMKHSRRGIEEFPVASFKGYTLRSLGEHLATVKVMHPEGRLILHCLEQPQLLCDQLDMLLDQQRAGEIV